MQQSVNYISSSVCSVYSNFFVSGCYAVMMSVIFIQLLEP